MTPSSSDPDSVSDASGGRTQPGNPAHADRTQKAARSDADPSLHDPPDSERMSRHVVGGSSTKSRTVEVSGRPQATDEIATPSEDEEDFEPLTPELFAEETHWLDLLLASMVLALAFLISAYRVSNAELWRHLQTGQYIAERGIPSHDIFSYTAGERLWLNFNWLFDAVAYPVHRSLGVAGLVAVKVLVVVLLTLGLFSIRHRGPTLWWTCCTTALILVVLNTEFAVVPELFAYLGLVAGLAIYHQAKVRGRVHWLWLLVPLQILWVNVDERYYMGLVLVAMLLLGEMGQGYLRRYFPNLPASLPKRGLRLLAAVAGLSVLGCFINPYDLKNPTSLAAFRFPYQLYAERYAGMREFAPLRPSLVSVYGSAYWERLDATGPTYQEVITAVVLILSLGSFVVNARRFSLSRFLTLAGFFVVGTLILANMFVLMIVATVVLALNAQEWFQAKFGTEVRLEWGWLIWGRGGRVVTVLAILPLCILGFAGWFRPGSVGQDIGLGIDPILQDRVEAVQGQLKDLPPHARGFNYDLHPNQANLLIAAVYPQQVFLDDRLEMYRRGRARPGQRTWVSLASLPSGVDVPVLGQDRPDLTEPLPEVPEWIGIPEKYAERLFYRSDQERLVLRGSLDAEEFTDLEALARRVPTFSLLQQTQTMPVRSEQEASRQAFLRALRTLYARSRLLYDPERQRLAFEGAMVPEQYVALGELSSDPDFRSAVDALFENTQDLVATYLRLRQAIATDETEVWKPLFDRYQISHLVLQMGIAPQFYRRFTQLWQSPHWVAVRPLGGSRAVFFRADLQDKELADYRDSHRLDFQSLAYNPPPEEDLMATTSIPPEPPTWYYDRLWPTRHMTTEKLLEGAHYQQLALDWLRPSVVEAGAYFLTSIRRMRQTLADHPNNPYAYLVLAHGYEELLRLERLLAPEGNLNVRYLQLIAALNHAITAEPNLLDAHDMLVRWYTERREWDLALRHIKKLAELSAETEERELYSTMDIVLLENRVEDMRRTLAEMQEQGVTPLQRAQHALQAGMPLVALEQLGEFSRFGAEETGPLFVHLYLETGQHEKALEVLEVMQELNIFPLGQWEELMGTVRLLQGNLDHEAQAIRRDVSATGLWEMSLDAKELAAMVSFLQGSSFQRSDLIPVVTQGGLLQGKVLDLVESSRQLTSEAVRSRSLGHALIGLTLLEAGAGPRAVEPFQQALEADPNMSIRPVLAYYLARISGQVIDPYGPAEYIWPTFETEGDQ